MKNNKIWLLLGIYIFISLFLMYIKYEEFKCKSTTDNKQIGLCANNHQLEEYSRLLYMRSKSNYITGGYTLRTYWSYAVLFKDTETDHSNIIEIAEKCLDKDSNCLDVYINEKKLKQEEKLLLYEKYLNNLKNVCDDAISLYTYRKLANELNVKLKFNDNC